MRAVAILRVAEYDQGVVGGFAGGACLLIAGCLVRSGLVGDVGMIVNWGGVSC